ncbi:Integrase catalytic domain-containing protein [Abeliophyllum distichum]|uniref:Integrase catalytic domain-containing protein n=1 Tax=Abeliophyllum distichum TaxID=126358 RepID=A0ABD1SYM3_9LAMI
MQKYNRQGDPTDHINVYKTRLQGYIPIAKCRNYHTTHVSDAKRWYKLKPRSIMNWPQLKQKFINVFIGNRATTTDMDQLNDTWRLTMNSRRNYAKASQNKPVESWQVYGHRPRGPPITFTEENDVDVHYPHYDDLVVPTVVAKNRLGRMLVDDGSAVNIMFESAFDQMEVNHELTANPEPLFIFTGDNLIPQRQITLAVNFKEPPCQVKKFMEFLVVDIPSVYHKVFGRLVLKDLQDVT